MKNKLKCKRGEFTTMTIIALALFSSITAIGAVKTAQGEWGRQGSERVGESNLANQLRCGSNVCGAVKLSVR